MSLLSTNSWMLLTKLGDSEFVGDLGQDPQEIYSKYKLFWAIIRPNHNTIHTIDKQYHVIYITVSRY